MTFTTVSDKIDEILAKYGIDFEHFAKNYHKYIKAGEDIAAYMESELEKYEQSKKG